MNKDRRKRIEELKDQVESLKTDIESVLEEEQEYYDNLPENLKYSQNGTTSEEALNNLESAVESIGDAVDKLDSAME